MVGEGDRLGEDLGDDLGEDLVAPKLGADDGHRLVSNVTTVARMFISLGEVGTDVPP